TGITIQGEDPRTTIIEREATISSPDFRIFHVADGGRLTLFGVTVANAEADGFGGAIFNSTLGTVRVERSTISDNTAGSGGGIDNRGTMVLIGSRITRNSLTINGGSGGGILNFGVLNIVRSTISGNSGDAGGGINNSGLFGSGTVRIDASTISGNTALAGGGIENITGTMTI